MILDDIINSYLFFDIKYYVLDVKLIGKLVNCICSNCYIVSLIFVCNYYLL